MTRLGIVLAAVCTFGASAWAGPITYTESGFLSGTLGNNALTNTAFTFVFNGDTTNITGSGLLLNIPTSNSLTIGAFTGSFTTTVHVGVNSPVGIIGFSDLANTNGITFLDGAAAGYNLASPISAAASTPFFAGGSLGTSLGTLIITDAQNLSFTATPVPEPSSLTFIGAGLLGLTRLRMRRRRA